MEQELAGIRNLNLGDVSGVLAVRTFEALLWQVPNTHQATDFTYMDSVEVTYIKETLLEETSGAM